jgi:23S rRNA U2552 (ribose-2'-O)-methylase RlmE/FtsJ
MANQDVAYALTGNKVSDQAETSTHNRIANQVQQRILVELQVISLLLYEQGKFNEDLASMRQSIADSIS